jgi:hypothetical protein
MLARHWRLQLVVVIMVLVAGIQYETENSESWEPSQFRRILEEFIQF